MDDPPSTYSMTMNGRSSCSPTSNTVITFREPELSGGEGLRLELGADLGITGVPVESTFTATGRSSTESVAR